MKMKISRVVENNVTVGFCAALVDDENNPIMGVGCMDEPVEITEVDRATMMNLIQELPMVVEDGETPAPRVESTPQISTEMDENIDYTFRDHLMRAFALEFEGRSFEELDEIIQDMIWRVCVKTTNDDLNNRISTVLHDRYDVEIDNPVEYLMERE